VASTNPYSYPSGSSSTSPIPSVASTNPSSYPSGSSSANPSFNYTMSLNTKHGDMGPMFDSLMKVTGGMLIAILLLVSIVFLGAASAVLLRCFRFCGSDSHQPTCRPGPSSDERRLRLFGSRSANPSEVDFIDPGPLDPYDRVNWSRHRPTGEFSDL
jgi:hypothetical protein